MSKSALSLLILLLFFSISAADQSEKEFWSTEKALANSALKSLQQEFPRVKAFETEGIPTRVYGDAFSFGSSPTASAEKFRLSHAAVLGTQPEDLQQYMRTDKSTSTVQLMYNQLTGDYKFTLVYYTQVRDGVPVFDGEVRVLVRNEVGYPSVLAVSSVKQLGDFLPGKANSAVFDIARSAALHDNPELTDFQNEEYVIWAGVDNMKEKPRSAVKVIGRNDFPEEWLYVVDAENGEILYKHDLIVFEDITGSTHGMSTEGIMSDECEDEVDMVIPYSLVSISGGSSVYSDGDGNFTITNSGSSDVTVQARLNGIYFNVDNYVGSETILSEIVTPPGPVDFMFNESNSSEYVRAQVNAYVQSNIVRNNVLKYNPNYPTVSTQTNFPVRVNRTDGYCPGNAWYSPSEQSINFCQSGSGYPNTAWQSVLHHEYGHHLVEMAGSGQDQYGEGMSDCVAMIYADDPRLGVGFYGNCTDPLRTADNTMQYPCSGEAHSCASLLSGCVWDVRNAMINTYPVTYMDTVANLCINSILLHTGYSITPQITIDWLTLDDDDMTLDNGTPHYGEICSGFNAHNMDCPELSLLFFEYPNGRPEIVSPNVQTAIEVVVNAQSVEPIPGTGVLYYSVDGGPFQQGTMNILSVDHYEAILPPVDCGGTIRWYVGAEAVGAGMVYDPSTAPAGYYQPVVATEQIVSFEDDFETDKGWTISGGEWERGAPTGGGGAYGNEDPSSAHGGTNIFGYDLNGDYGNNIPEYHLTSPAIDCSNLTGGILKFYRWLNVEQPSYDHAYVRVSNNGTSWSTIWENDETITDNSWLYQEFDVSAYADGASTFYIRFTMGTTDGSWTYSGWNIDDLELVGYECDANSPQISTVSLPEWTQGQPYSFQLEATGGTGAYTWADAYGDLVGTGLSLAADGLLSGTPVSASTISFTASVTDEALLTDEELLNMKVNGAVTITTDSLPHWTEGIFLTRTLSTQGGTGVISWADKNGDLTGTGMTLSSTGQFSGTPSVNGVVTFTAQALDSTGSVGEKTFDFIINGPMTITTTEIPNAAINTAYSFTLESSGGTGHIVWSDVNNDFDGTGLTLDNTGLISGIPTVGGNINFTAHVVDDLGSEDSQVLSLFVDEPLVIMTDSIPEWTIGNEFSFQIEAVGGYGTRVWSDKNDDLTGVGLTLSTEGLINGTPNTIGDHNFTAMVTDDSSQVEEQAYTLHFNQQIAFVTDTLPEWTAKMPFSKAIIATGGTGTITMVDKNEDLVGTGFSLSGFGILSSNFPLPGTTEFTVLATDQGGDSEERIFTLLVNPAIQIMVPALPQVTVGGEYSFHIPSNGGTGERVYSDLNNDLDGTGISLSVDGMLIGIPVSSGTINFTVRVEDEIGASTDEPLTLVVNPAISVTTTILPDWTINQPYSEEITMTGGTGEMTCTDMNNDLDGTGLVLETHGVISGTPTVEGPVSFTVNVADEGGGTAQQALGLTINPAVGITTESIADGTSEEPFSVQLEAGGGTGDLVWSDLNGDLSGTGLSLSETGLLEGTPPDAMEVIFTAQAEDMTGSTDSREYTFNINPAYICGDANNDLNVNIIDITFMIAYLYQSGEAPVYPESADVNADGSINIIDITALIGFLYQDGPEPTCP